MDGAAPATLNWIAIAWLIACCAGAAAIIGIIQLWRGGRLFLAFGLLLAPWLLVVTDPRIIPVYIDFAFDPDGWGNPVLPVWMTPLVGVVLIVAAAVRALKRWDERD